MAQPGVWWRDAGVPINIRVCEHVYVRMCAYGSNRPGNTCVGGNQAAKTGDYTGIGT